MTLACAMPAPPRQARRGLPLRPRHGQQHRRNQSASAPTRGINDPNAATADRHAERSWTMLRQLGYADAGAASKTSFELPVTTVVGDMSSDTLVRLAYTRTGAVIAEANFDTPHPASWCDPPHEFGVGACSPASARSPSSCCGRLSSATAGRPLSRSPYSASPKAPGPARARRDGPDERRPPRRLGANAMLDASRGYRQLRRRFCGRARPVAARRPARCGRRQDPLAVTLAASRCFPAAIRVEVSRKDPPGDVST
jgi:hypothetical protein